MESGRRTTRTLLGLLLMSPFGIEAEESGQLETQSFVRFDFTVLPAPERVRPPHLPLAFAYTARYRLEDGPNGYPKDTGLSQIPALFASDTLGS